MTAPSATTTASSVPTRPEDERLPLGRTAAFGLQHVLTMYGGIVAVPLIVGNAAGIGSTDIAKLITACLFIGGLATILQSVGLPSSAASCRWCRASPSPRSPPSPRSSATAR